MSGKRKFALAFLAAVLLVAGVVVLWGPRTAMASIGGVVALILLWPVLLFVIGLVGALVIGLLTNDGAGADVAGTGIEGGLKYYPWLMRIRRAWFWGGLLGALVATGGLYAYVEHQIVRKESTTRLQVDQLARLLATHHDAHDAYPAQRGPYLHQALELDRDATWNGVPLADAWGRPLTYTVHRTDATDQFELASLGWNGRRDAMAGDDITAQGAAARNLGRRMVDAARRKISDLLDRKKTRDK